MNQKLGDRIVAFLQAVLYPNDPDYSFITVEELANGLEVSQHAIAGALKHLGDAKLAYGIDWEKAGVTGAGEDIIYLTAAGWTHKGDA